jgi:hypothetical protein
MNTYKDFVVLNNMLLDPRDVHLFVDWLLACEKDSQAHKIGEAMQAAIDNYMSSIVLNNIEVTTAHTIALNFPGGAENDNNA